MRRSRINRFPDGGLRPVPHPKRRGDVGRSIGADPGGSDLDSSRYIIHLSVGVPPAQLFLWEIAKATITKKTGTSNITTKKPVNNLTSNANANQSVTTVF